MKCASLSRSRGLHKTSLGLPRLLNNAATAALIAATTAGKALVDDDWPSPNSLATERRCPTEPPTLATVITIVIVANLKPAKLMGVESNGMVLAASTEGGAPILLAVEGEPGMRVR